jgi:prepilin-type N-terminal cleavage/methylation domain-containing protein
MPRADISSVGPDGRSGTDDDIGNWTVKSRTNAVVERAQQTGGTITAGRRLALSFQTSRPSEVAARGFTLLELLVVLTLLSVVIAVALPMLGAFSGAQPRYRSTTLVSTNAPGTEPCCGRRHSDDGLA